MVRDRAAGRRRSSPDHRHRSRARVRPRCRRTRARARVRPRSRRARAPARRARPGRARTAARAGCGAPGACAPRATACAQTRSTPPGAVMPSAKTSARCSGRYSGVSIWPRPSWWACSPPGARRPAGPGSQVGARHVVAPEQVRPVRARRRTSARTGPRRARGPASSTISAVGANASIRPTRRRRRAAGRAGPAGSPRRGTRRRRRRPRAPSRIPRARRGGAGATATARRRRPHLDRHAAGHTPARRGRKAAGRRVQPTGTRARTVVPAPSGHSTEIRPPKA